MKTSLLAALATMAALGCKDSPSPGEAMPPASVTPPVPSSSAVVFEGTVTKVEPLRAHAGNVFVVDADPRYAVTVKVESVASGERLWPSGADPVFAIHSPARTFATPDTPRGRFSFRYERDDAGGTLSVTSRR